MFGTELDTAYYESQPIEKKEPSLQKDHDPEIVYNPAIQIPMNPVFQQNQEKILQLQKELEVQKIINKQNDTEPLYERFLSKKKDVMKLICISLTVLLAISVHFVASDFLKSYLQNNVFSQNKELTLKILYPFTVFMTLWSIKVFNK